MKKAKIRLRVATAKDIEGDVLAQIVKELAGEVIVFEDSERDGQFDGTMNDRAM